ncbi:MULTISPECIES: immunity 22 family protein [unclassified Clostridium]|uniref:immunity 22 family protein n=1 Tax=unclassified Clostridium TaxID=2614128 RepID=UPI0025BFA655|nr:MULTISPECIES: immunity 22 family protein [unclassified Clostridium]
MEKRGKVSLWIGNFNSVVELKKYLCVGYTADGDQIYSKFANEFDFGHTDEDFIEYEFYDQKMTLIETLLRPFSYSDTITCRFGNLLGKNVLDRSVNSIILLYDYEHEEDIVQSNNIEYIGCVSYLK